MTFNIRYRKTCFLKDQSNTVCNRTVQCFRLRTVHLIGRHNDYSLKFLSEILQTFGVSVSIIVFRLLVKTFCILKILPLNTTFNIFSLLCICYHQCFRLRTVHSIGGHCWCMRNDYSLKFLSEIFTLTNVRGQCFNYCFQVISE